MSTSVSPAFSAVIGRSPGLTAAVRKLQRALDRASRSERPPSILIVGETGTGKGLLAREIHRASARSGGPLIHVNCAAIPETLLEAELFGVTRGAFTDARVPKPGLMRAAHRGTLFLDEVGLLPAGVQAKLLTALEERSVRALGSTQTEPVDILLIAASHVDLVAEVRAGRFRRELYHRLAVITVTLPPLRERGDDVVEIARSVLSRACMDYRIAPKTLGADAIRAILAHSWPGNVRELANTIERAVLTCDASVIDAADLELAGTSANSTDAVSEHSRGYRGGAGRHQIALAEYERAQLSDAIRRANGSVARAAAALGLPRSSLRYRLAKLGLDDERGRASAHREFRLAPTDAAAGRTPALPTALRWEERYLTVIRAVLRGHDAAMGDGLLEDLGDKAYAFGGHIEEVEPAGLVTVFGVRESREAPSRAAHAAMAMHRSVEQARDAAGLPLQFSIALVVRPILMTRIGDAVRLDLEGKRRALADLDTLLRGDPADGILTDDESARHLARRFRFEPSAPASDTRRAVAVHRIVGPESAVPDTQPVPFVGRLRELAALQRALNASADGAQTVALCGEAGLGKSRLLAEFRASCGGQGIEWLEGHSLPSTAGDPYAPLVAIVRRACGVEPGTSQEAAARALGAALDTLGLERDRVEVSLRYLLGIEEVDSAVDTPPTPLREGIHDALVTLLLHTARARTTVVVVEDVHWLDDASRKLLATLVRRLAGAPLLLIFTARAGTPLPWLDPRRTTQIDLQPLLPSESLVLLRNVLGGLPVSDAVLANVLTRAEGNPLFLEELGRQVREAAVPSTDAPLPGTIQEILQARIAGLPSATRDLLDAAAVVGVEFPARLWEAVRGGRLAGSELAVLERLDLITARHQNGQLFGFRHALIQETAYAMLSDAHRRRLHLETAQALERLHEHNQTEVLDQLAHHYARSGDVARAVEYLTRFADHATRANAKAEAISALQEALTCIERVPEGAVQDQLFLRFIIRERDMLRYLGDVRPGTLELLLRQRNRVDAIHEPELERTYYLWLGRVGTSRGEFELGVECAERAVRLAVAAADRTIEGAAHAVMAHAHSWLGHGDVALAAGRRAVALLENIDDAFWRAYAYRGLTLAHLGRFEMVEAARAAEQLATAAAEADSGFLSFSALWMAALAELYAGSSERALVQMRKAFELAPTPFQLGQASAMIGVIHVERGEPAPAITLLTPLVSDLARLRQRHVQALFMSYLAEAHRLEGDSARAHELALQARSLASASRYRLAYALATRVAGLAAQGNGDFDGAREYLTDALQTFESIPCSYEADRVRAQLATLPGAREVSASQ